MPVDYQRNLANGGLMAVWRITEPEEDLAAMIMLNSDMELQLNRFTCPKRRLEWLASRALIYNTTGCIPLVEYNKNGQPFVRQTEQNISISHTKGFAAVAISPKVTTGIDIEYPSERISRLSPRFVSDLENSFIPLENPSIYHALIWCAKETVYKMAAQPGIGFIDDIIVLPFTAEYEGLFNVKYFVKEEEKNVQLLYKVTTDYYLVWHY
jgi:phosphopantetheinyl transferase